MWSVILGWESLNSGLCVFYWQRPIGIFSLLDEQSRFPKATDYTLVDQWANKFNDHAHFKQDLRDELVFTIRHYAGKVILVVGLF